MLKCRAFSSTSKPSASVVAVNSHGALPLFSVWALAIFCETGALYDTGCSVVIGAGNGSSSVTFFGLGVGLGSGLTCGFGLMDSADVGPDVVGTVGGVCCAKVCGLA